MAILMLLTMLFTISLIALIGIVSYKIIKNKTLPENNYTPFDYITATATVEFHEEKEVNEEENKQGDNKEKSKK